MEGGPMVDRTQFSVEGGDGGEILCAVEWYHGIEALMRRSGGRERCLWS